MKILRTKKFASTDKPDHLISFINPTRRTVANAERWKEFNKETGGNRFRLNVGDTKKDFQTWQQGKFGNII